MFDVMIAPDICENCLRPYAEPNLPLCDSCAKDLEHGIIKKTALKMAKIPSVQKYVVRADHVILSSSDVYGLTDIEADMLIVELVYLNYENIRKEKL